MSKDQYEVEDDKSTQEWTEGTALNEFEALKKRLKAEAEALATKLEIVDPSQS